MEQQPNRFRILSLDGGGSWAMLQAMALADLHGPDMPGHDILQQYHMAVANSGGAIMLAALCCNVTPGQMIKFYQDEQQVRKAFRRIPLYPVTNWVGFGPRFSTEAKRKGLDELFSLLNSANIHRLPLHRIPSMGFATQLVILSQHYDLQRLKLFRSYGHRFGSPSTVSLLDAVHASSTAPVNFFNQPANVADERYWDGGVSGHNNPVMAALTEAISNGQSPAAIRILSIGTGNTQLPLPPTGKTGSPLFQEMKRSSLIQDVQKMATAVLEEPPTSATFSSHILLAELQGKDVTRPGSLVRVNPLVAPLGDSSTGYSCPRFNAATDDLSLFRQLLDMDLAAVRQDDLNAIKLFGQAWLTSTSTDIGVRNQPLHAKNDLTEVIGFGNFASAKAHWLSIR